MNTTPLPTVFTTQHHASRMIAFALLIVAVQVLVATPLLSVRLLTGGQPLLHWVVGVLSAGIVVMLLFRFEAPLALLARRLCDAAEVISPHRWLAGAIAFGTLLRLAWVTTYPAAPASDGAIYLALAQNLSDGGMYQVAGTRAYWPPGYPLFLTPWLHTFGSSLPSILVLNICLFILSVLSTYYLAQHCFGGVAATFAAILLALWPTYVAMAGLPEKEQLVMLLITSSFAILYGSSTQSPLRVLAGGLLLGAASLVQPSCLLLPVVVLIADFLRGAQGRHIITRAALIALAMAIVIGPWTIRNYNVFGQFVLISTNGGSNFYRANNPLATGGYTERGEIDTSDLPEVEASAVAGRLGLAWILENPIAFVRLSIEKQILFLGDDSTGVYATLRRGGVEVSEIEYAAWKGAANAYWLVAWCMILMPLIRRGSEITRFYSALSPVILSFFYFYALHSVFESNGKYHLPVLSMVAIMAAAGVAMNRKMVK